MSYIVISDLHYHECPEFPTIDIANSVLQQVEDYILKNKIDKVFHLGDLYHSRIKMPVRTIKPLIDRFSEWCERGIDIYLLKGNPMHDGDNDDYNGHLFPMANVIHKPSVYKIDEWGVYFLPFASRESLMHQINLWRKESPYKKVLFVHYALQGASILDYEVQLKDSLSKKDLSWFDMVFAGHYHKHQEVWKNAWHVGSPYRISFAERDDKKGFIHVDNDKVKFIELDVPKMIQLEINSNDFAHKGEVKGSFIKIIINGTESFIRNFDYEGNKKDWLGLGALGVKFEIKRTDDIREVREARIKKEDTPEKMIDRYFEFTKDQNPNLDVKKLKHLAYIAMKREPNG